MADSVIAMKGKDFVLVATDCFASSSIIKTKDDEDKIYVIDDDKLLGISGPNAERNSFGEYLLANMHLNKYRNDLPHDIDAVAHFTQTSLAEALRSAPYQANCMLGGMMDDIPKLYWLDYMASMTEVDKGAHGYAAYFTLGLLDRYWKPNMDREECLEIIKKCTLELKNRFLLSQHKVLVKIAGSTGIEQHIIEV